MRLQAGLLLGLFAPLAASQGYCPAGPTATTDSNLGAMNFVGNNELSYTPPCPGVVGLDDQTSKTLYLSPGSTYATSTVAYSSCGANYPNAGTIWIDLNQNQAFDTEEVMGSWTGTPPHTQTVTLTIPAGTPKGTTRMRVMQRESGTLPLVACAQYTWGACADFTVVIGTGGPGGEGGMSGGTIVLIILIVVIPVYIIGGCIFMRKQRGTSTMAESCPHNEFWFALPGLVKDGCLFTVGKIKGLGGGGRGTADGYDEV